MSIQEIAPGMADEAVLELAAAESRILVTFDRDYGELIFVRASAHHDLSFTSASIPLRQTNSTP